MEIVQVEQVVLLAEHLNFRNAAAAAGVSASTLSRRLGDLEAELGVELFNRTRHQVALTDAGRVFVEEARVTLHQLRRAARMCQRAGRGEAGQLRIGHGGSAAVPILGEALAKLRAARPEVVLHVAEAPSPQLLEGLRSHHFDLVLARPPLAAEGIDHVHLLDEQLVVALPCGHRLARHEQLDLSDLSDVRIVVSPRAIYPGPYDKVVDLWARAGITPNVADEAIGQLSLLAMVSAGLGVTMVPAWCARTLSVAGVVFVPMVATHARLALHLAWRLDDRSVALSTARSAVRAAARRL